MTSTKAVAAIAVVVVVVVAAVAGFALTNNGGGNDTPTGTTAIGSSVSVGDAYTLETEYKEGNQTPTSAVTEYRATAVENGVVTVEKTTGNEKETFTQTEDEFLNNVATTGPVGKFLRTESINGHKCNVYEDRAIVGNSQIEVVTTEWIGEGSNVIYQTIIAIKSDTGDELQRITLQDTNMIRDDANPGYVPPAPEVPEQTDTVRTDLKVGDYVEYRELDDWDTERFTIIKIEGNTVWYTDDDDDWDDWDDAERTTVDGFLAMFMYTGTGEPSKTETLRTPSFGDVLCDVYVIDHDVFPWMDWDETITLWVGQSNNVIYQFEDREHGDDDRDGYQLVGSSLFQGAPSGGEPSKPTPPAPAADNRYGVELAVGDSYTIVEEDGDRITYEIVAIDGRVLVKETEHKFSGHDDIEYDWETGNEFLEEIMLTEQQVQRLGEPIRTETVSGVDCSVYRYDGDEFIWVASNYVVWQVQDDDDRDVERLESLNIAALV